MKKVLSFILCIALLSSVLVFSVAAESNAGIAPCLNNTANTDTGFFIEDGVAYVTISYDGYQGITTGATIKTKLQKKFLFFFWQDVETWVDETNEVYYLTEHSKSLSEKTTYKVIVEYEIRGTGGSADVLTAEIERNYK